MITDVIDLGCQPHGTEVSVGPLLRRFCPARFHGFDPYPGTQERAFTTSHGTQVVIRRMAAWTYNGMETMKLGATRWEATRASLVKERAVNGPEVEVKCFDLAAFVQKCANETPEPRIVVKFDIEGAEYTLLQHLHEKGIDSLVELALVEWHELPGCVEWQHELMGKLRCEVQPW